MVKHRIRFTMDAVDGIDSIFAYIADNNRDAAKKMLERLESAISKLADNPRLGSVLPTNDQSLVEPGYRRIVVKPYSVFYRIGKEVIFIARVIHGRRDWMHLLFEQDLGDV